jgi:hypothetical protein
LDPRSSSALDSPLQSCSSPAGDCWGSFALPSGLPYAGWTAPPLNEVGSIGRAAMGVRCESVGSHCPESLSCFHAPAVMSLQLHGFCIYPRLCFLRHSPSERCLIGSRWLTKTARCQADCRASPNLFLSGLYHHRSTMFDNSLSRLWHRSEIDRDESSRRSWPSFSRREHSSCCAAVFL